jgi:hypothetical protein
MVRFAILTVLTGAFAALAPATIVHAEGPASETLLAQASAKKKPAAKKPAGKAAKEQSAAAVFNPERPWPQFLGPNRDNRSLETGLARSWPETGPKVVWTAEGLGNGYSAVSVADGLVFTMGAIGEDEHLIAIRLSSGEVAWKTRTGSRRGDGQGDGPRGTPAVDGDFVYGLGANGDLVCCEIKAGEVAWRKNILSAFEGNNIGWGISESPLVDGGRVVVSPGGAKGTIVALDKLSGKTEWATVAPERTDAGYASVVPIEVGGVKQYVQFLSRGVMGVRASDGKALWGNNKAANGTANCSSILYANNMVFSSSGYGTGAAMIKLAGTQATLGYFTKDMESHHGGMVLVDGHVYGASDPGILRCIELSTGKKKWENRSVGKGAVTWVDGMLVLRSEGGPVALVACQPDKYEELGRFEPGDRSGRSTWPYPVVAAGKLFLRDQEKMTAYDLAK